VTGAGGAPARPADVRSASVWAGELVMSLLMLVSYSISMRDSSVLIS
jgi:hypothetical protein